MNIDGINTGYVLDHIKAGKGMQIYNFLGLENLDCGALVRILSEPKNCLVKQYAKLFEMDGVELEFTPDALTAVAEKASYITPVPGGVGPMTRAILMKNVLAAAKDHQK